MPMSAALPQLFRQHEQELLAQWLGLLQKSTTIGTDRFRRGELEAQCREFLRLFIAATSNGNLTDVDAADYKELCGFLGGMSRARALQGASPIETASFVFLLKEPVFGLLRDAAGVDAADGLWTVNLLLDRLGLYTTEVHQKSREEIIIRQQQEIAELSTPVVQLWRSILALPLIGTLDSERTQVVMENLLQRIVETGAEIAIIDITGVPTVDTLVAQHLLKTVAAARLMGADCIISGIRPQIAQTIVHLGVELNVTSKANMADAFAVALRRTGQSVVRTKPGD
jgi:rsbT co-antagonist protein RsbR